MRVHLFSVRGTRRETLLKTLRSRFPINDDDSLHSGNMRPPSVIFPTQMDRRSGLRVPVQHSLARGPEMPSAKPSMSTAVISWWLSDGDEECPHCGQLYV